MKGRLVSVLVGALAMALIVIAAGAAAGVRVPNGSIGLRKLTPHLRKLVTERGLQGPAGPAGQTGSAGAVGAPGAPGAEGKSASGKLLTYSLVGPAPAGEVILPPQTVVLTREDGGPQESIGPLTFHASCESEGEDTIRGKLEVTSSQNGIVLNGQALNAGVTRTVQQASVSGGGLEESFAAVVRATNEDGSFAMQGVMSLLLGLPGGCHFYGSLIEDS
jgi:hypothetical protein